METEAREAIEAAQQAYGMAMASWNVAEASDAAIGLVRFLNKYIDTRAPWALAKNEDPSLPAVIFSMLSCIRAAEALVSPMMPWAADEIARQLGHEPLRSWDAIGQPSTLIAGTALAHPEPIFPRIDPKKAKELGGSEDGKSGSAKEAKGDRSPTPQPSQTLTTPHQTSQTLATPHQPSQISIDDFAKVELRVARILEAEPLEGSDKLMKIQVMIGDEKRQVVAGIRKSYEPIDLIGRQVVIVYNLKPATLRGAESQGMLLAAVDENGDAILLQPDRETPEGARVR